MRLNVWNSRWGISVHHTFWQEVLVCTDRPEVRWLAPEVFPHLNIPWFKQRNRPCFEVVCMHQRLVTWSSSLKIASRLWNQTHLKHLYVSKHQTGQGKTRSLFETTVLREAVIKFIENVLGLWLLWANLIVFKVPGSNTSPSCSFCFFRSEPPTNPMTTRCAWRNVCYFENTFLAIGRKLFQCVLALRLSCGWESILWTTEQ